MNVRFSSLTRIMCLLLLSLSFFCFEPHVSCAPQTSVGTETAIVIHGRDYYRGSTHLVITHSALRMDLGDEGNIYLVAQAPDWRVVFYNKRDGVGMDMPLAEYTKHYPRWWPFQRIPKTGVRFPPLEKLGTVVYLGKNCLKYGQLNIAESGMIDRRQRYQAIHYVWCDERIPPQVCQILGTLVGDPNLPGVRLYQENLQATSRKVTTGRDLVSLYDSASAPARTLWTLKIEEKAYPKTYFSYPAKFRNVKSEMDVWTDSAKQKEGEEFLHDMKLGD